MKKNNQKHQADRITGDIRIPLELRSGGLFEEINPLKVPTSLLLDPSDEFDAVLIELRELHQRKKADYSETGNRFSNFEEAAHDAQISVMQTFENMLGIKKARVMVLTKPGAIPKNESLRDTYRDRCVYSILQLAYFDKKAKESK